MAAAKRQPLNPSRAKAQGGKDAHAELRAALMVELPAKLAQSGAGQAAAVLRRIAGGTADLDELLEQLQGVHDELRAAISQLAPIDKDAARGLSKLADVAAMADMLSEDEMLERLEFCRQRT